MRRSTAAALLGAAALAATTLVAPGALAATTLVAPGAAAAPSFPDVIPLPDGFQPEGIASGPGTTVYAGSLADGAIWSGDLRTGEGDLLVDGATGTVAVGLEYDTATGRLWVAGGPTNEVRVYDAASGAELASYAVAGTGFLNDIAVTRDAAYVTDSFGTSLVVIPTPSGSLDTDAELLPLSGDFRLAAGFNLNGIEQAAGTLVVVQSGTGLLFTVDPATGATTTIDLGGERLTAGDGIHLQGRTLYVVRNQLDLVAKVQLSGDLGRGTVVAELRADAFDVPTTATLVAGRVYAVNARFGTTPSPDTAYDIVQAPRR